jgi:hypothetical protein
MSMEDVGSAYDSDSSNGEDEFEREDAEETMKSFRKE